MKKVKAVTIVKKLIPVLFLLVIIAIILIVVIYKEEEEPEEIIRVNEYEALDNKITLENDKLKFVMDSSTTQFLVTVKSTGKTWYSNPQDADEDTIALSTDIDNLKSTLLLTYSTINGVDTLYNNYKYSMSTGLYNIKATNDYVKVYYSIGEVEKEYIAPRVISAKRMEELLSNMSHTNANTVEQYYKKYDINNLGKKDDKNELLKQYPILENEIIYVIRDGIKDNLKKKFETYFSDAGYTEKEYAEEKELYVIDSSSTKPVFNINMEYSLDDSDLVVEICKDEIEYKEDYPLLTLNVLPFFGAAGTSEKGYMLVPEGGGSIIHFNNGKTVQNSYYSNMYGWDMAQGRTSLVHETRNDYGVYGISNSEESFICMLEEGAAYASIQADISGRINSYNYVNASYSILHREQCDVADKYNGEMFVYEQSIPEEDIVTRYRFINSGGYVDLANAYHDYLEEKYGDKFTENDDNDVPVAVEIIGAVDKVGQVLGVPVSKTLELTTYQEATKMIETLRANGVTNMSVKLSGWMNGGIKQTILTDVHLIKELGRKKDFKSLTSYATENGINIYLDGVTNYAYNNKLFDSFFIFKDAATLASKKKVELLDFDPIYYGKQEWMDSYYLLKPELITKMMANLADAAKTYKAAGVSFRDIGYQLSADYSQKHLVSRQQAENEQIKQLNKISDLSLGIMTNKGNDYTLGATDFITNMDLNGSDYNIIDETVPFYQIAIHGYVNYAGEALNLVGDNQEELLKSAEYGAGLYFTFMEADTSILQNTCYTQYYGASFDAWKDNMLTIYQKYEKNLGGTFNQRITDHEIIDSGITVTTYEDGTRVYVNYNYEDYKIAGGSILPARDYLVIR
ncbi:hypothetical protein C8E03_101484 [Lachnotalea glycerini]|uniref:Uncharacterized protein n=1 Tax=Lachnotalea glycerini TaxID=1763509 RepID=A0A318EWK2_9FIRM|nr:DUF5696 domain-containing protein [Lachnotalea glycerini]PXV95853.1 hypothetical protein C8E03_101484 [Lachnotalea glycerini]